MNHIKHILSFLLILILQLSFSKGFASIYFVEELYHSDIEFSETGKPNIDFLEPNLNENNIFEPYFLENVSCPSVSIFEDYAELVQSWKTIKYCGDDDLAKLATNVDELDVVAKNANEIKAAGGYKVWKAATKSNKLPTVTFVDSYTPSFTGKIAEFRNPDGSLYGRLYRQFPSSSKVEYTFKLTKPDGNIISIKGLTAEIDNGFVEIDLLLDQVQGKGIGKVIFDDVFKHLDGTGVKFKGFRGRWEGNNPNYASGASDNLTKYWQARKTKTMSEAAFETWSGKRAFENGFTKAKVNEISQNLIIVEFTK
jgi:hypothetical protein